VEKILGGFVEAMTSPRVRELFEKQALQPMDPMSAQELAALYAADAEKYAKVIRETGMRRSE
jgi:tripartite-type tricarboxylate transporter receptor subunit TctC